MAKKYEPPEYKKFPVKGKSKRFQLMNNTSEGITKTEAEKRAKRLRSAFHVRTHTHGRKRYLYTREKGK